MCSHVRISACCLQNQHQGDWSVNGAIEVGPYQAAEGVRPCTMAEATISDSYEDILPSVEGQLGGSITSCKPGGQSQHGFVTP